MSGTTPVSTRLDVRSYGAKGDGTTDDSAAINLALVALTAAGGGTLYFPGTIGSTPATYIVKAAALTVTGNNVTFRGDGPTLSVIKMGNASSVQRLVVVGSHSNTTFVDLGFDGNFINQTYAAATLNTGIDGTGSTRTRVLNCQFHAFGYSSAADAAYAQCVSLYSALDCEVDSCHFISNLAFEIILNGTLGAKITGNTFGSPNLAESKANTNWWDTYSGGFGTFAASASKLYFAGNRMFGAARSSTLNAFGALITVDGSNSSVQSSDVQIQNNEFHGLGNSRGTVAVTNGSGVIIGTNTVFVSGDVGRTFQAEGDGTVYTVSAYTSATQITVTPVIVRATASGLRYLYQNSGDVIAAYNVDRLTITGNAVYDSGDNGYDVAASPAGYFTQHVMFASNIAARSQVDGLYVGGAVFDGLFSGNLFVNNGRKQLANHQAAIELSPTDQGTQSGQNMWHLSFIGNQFLDDQAVATQICGFQIESGQSAKVFSCTLNGNTFFAFSGGGTLFDASTTSTMQGTEFNFPSFGSAAQFTPVAFASLGAINGSSLANGTIVYCFDAKNVVDDGAVAGAVAASGGTGAFVKRQNGKWIAN